MLSEAAIHGFDGTVEGRSIVKVVRAFRIVKHGMRMLVELIGAETARLEDYYKQLGLGWYLHLSSCRMHRGGYDIENAEFLHCDWEPIRPAGSLPEDCMHRPGRHFRRLVSLLLHSILMQPGAELLPLLHHHGGRIIATGPSQGRT